MMMVRSNPKAVHTRRQVAATSRGDRSLAVFRFGDRLQNSPYFAYSSKSEQSNERSLTPRFTDFLTDFEKKTDCFAV